MSDAPAAGNIQGALHIPTPLGRKKKIRKFAPRTLYVNRPVLNAEDLIAWAKEFAGCETCVTPDDMHVTIAFSKKPIEWPQPMKDVKLAFNVKNAHVAMFGPEGDCVVLTFDSEDLQERWQFFCDQGASWSWPDYSPHITLSYHGFNRNGITPQQIPPYTGRIVLGPEEFNEVSDGWGDDVVQKGGPDQPRDEKGQWSAGAGESEKDHAKRLRQGWRDSKGTDHKLNEHLVKSSGAKVNVDPKSGVDEKTANEIVAHVAQDGSFKDVLKGKTVEIKDLGARIHGTQRGNTTYLDSKSIKEHGPGFGASILAHELTHSKLSAAGIPTGQQEPRVLHSAGMWAGLQHVLVKDKNPVAAAGFKKAAVLQGIKMK